MSSGGPQRRHGPLMERIGVGLFRRLGHRKGEVVADDEIFFLNPQELLALRSIQRWTIARAAIAGALSALVAAVTEVLALPLLGDNPELATVDQTIRFWTLVGGATVMATALEIGWLYWDALNSVHNLSRAAGLDLFGGGDNRIIASALARAALELPNPRDPAFGVDPHRETSKAMLVAATLIYKAKIGLSNFLLKMLIRRLMGRAAVRAWLAFVAVPVTALWNALVAWRILREARIRVMGPSAAVDLIQKAVPEPKTLSASTKRLLLQAVASSMVRTKDRHPNLVALLRATVGHLAPTTEEVPDDWRLFLSGLDQVSKPEQSTALRVYAIAAFIDGRLARSEVALLDEAYKQCGLELDRRVLKRLYRRFVRGKRIGTEDVAALLDG